MRRKRRDDWRTVTAAAGGFAVGTALTALLLWNGPAGSRAWSAEDCGRATLESAEPAVVAHDTARSGEPVATPPASGAPRIGADPISSLRARDLLLPVEGISRGSLRGSFAEKRGSDRLHEAIDILAPRNTPVIAVEDGVIARLFSSKAGGNTIYQFDPTTTYVYYYAHLERYADGVKDGAAVRRGQVIGYVGTSGNAPKDTPHLHFAIFRLTAQKQWWDGAPIDPFEVLR